LGSALFDALIKRAMQQPYYAVHYLVNIMSRREISSQTFNLHQNIVEQYMQNAATTPALSSLIFLF
jgi:hypothetical protein